MSKIEAELKADFARRLAAKKKELEKAGDKGSDGPGAVKPKVKS